MTGTARTHRSLRRVVAALLLAAVAGCGGGEPPGAPAAVEGAGLDTVAVLPAAADGERLFDGVVEAVQQAVIAAQTGGRIVSLVRDVDEDVAPGGLIMRINDVEQRAQRDAAVQALSEAEAVAVEARSTFERTRALVAGRLLSQADLDRATSARDAAEARLAAARARVTAAREQLGYTEVRAPFAGVVTRRHVEVGEAVSPGQPLLELAAPGALRVVVDVPQALADDVRRLGSARVHASGAVLDSSRITVFPAAAPGSNTVRVRIDLAPGAHALLPGMFVKAGFRLGGDASLRIPESLVVRRGEVTAVYVVGPDGRVALRQVRLGRSEGGQVEVLAGLESGERVATDPVAATLAIEGR